MHANNTRLSTNSNNTMNKLALPFGEGFLIVDEGAIIYCQARGNYADIHLRDGRTVKVHSGLKELEKQLSLASFFRTHQSFLVNMEHVSMWLPKEEQTLCLSDGSKVQVARSRRKALQERLKFI